MHDLSTKSKQGHFGIARKFKERWRVFRLGILANWLLALAFSVHQSAARGAATQADVPEYTVQGLLSKKSIRYSEEKKSFYYDNSTYGFEVSVSGCKWLMKLGTHDPELYDHRIISSDGVDCYLLLNYETRQRLNAAKGIPTINVGDGIVIKGNVPCFLDANEAGTLWIAYGSGCYLAEHAHDKRKVVPYCNYVRFQSILPGENSALEQAVVSLNNSPPNLPAAIVYYFHPTLLDNTSRTWEISPGLSLSSLFTNVNYQTLSFTNINGLLFPKEASSSLYRPDRSLLPKFVPQLCEEVHLDATNIFLNAPMASFKPKLPGYTAIFEARFADGASGTFELFATNDWPSEEVAKHTKAYLDSRRTIVSTDNPRRKTATFVAVLFIAALPLALWFFNRKHANQ